MSTSEMLLARILEQLELLNARLSTGEARSHVEVRTSTRGTDVAVKQYSGSPLGETGDEAVAEYVRLFREVEARLLGHS